MRSGAWCRTDRCDECGRSAWSWVAIEWLGLGLLVLAVVRVAGVL